MFIEKKIPTKVEGFAMYVFDLNQSCEIVVTENS